ncbi:MAG: hypothetical protein HQK50_02115 [Oligoflexia bacterium]|nr:hypothetical protein [Oligoflexia bacterium]MBF0364334.1 hypothetical protein [Oligoflexia bacterium]
MKSNKAQIINERLTSLDVFSERNSVRECRDVAIGEYLIYFCAEERRFVYSVVVGMPANPVKKVTLVCRQLHRSSVGTLRLDKFTVYKIDSKILSQISLVELPE